MFDVLADPEEREDLSLSMPDKAKEILAKMKQTEKQCLMGNSSHQFTVVPARQRPARPACVHSCPRDRLLSAVLAISTCSGEYVYTIKPQFAPDSGSKSCIHTHRSKYDDGGVY